MKVNFIQYGWLDSYHLVKKIEETGTYDITKLADKVLHRFGVYHEHMRGPVDVYNNEQIIARTYKSRVRWNPENYDFDYQDLANEFREAIETSNRTLFLLSVTTTPMVYSYDTFTPVHGILLRYALA